MTHNDLAPHKQRTRQHIIADLSVHHVEGIILRAGHTAQRVDKDYGYDLLLFTFDEQGYCEPDFLSLQIKASESLSADGADYIFDLDIRDYNLWMHDRLPVVLVLYDATCDAAFWLWVQGYFDEHPECRPKQNARSIRVRVPMRQKLNRRAIAKMQKLKRQARHPVIGGQP